MQHSIVTVFVPLAAYILMASAHQQPTSWTNPYFFYPNYNIPLALPTQKVSADEKAGNQQQLFTNYNDHSMQNTLGSHVVLLTTCLRDLKTTKADLAVTHTTVESVKNELKDTKANLAQTHTMVEKVKNELKENSELLTNLMATVENLKKEMNVGSASSIGRMPKSCDDLHKIGHRKSGLFSVVGNKTVDNVYCDFTKPTNDAGFQKLIGYVDVKTSPVYFHAQRNSAYGNINTAIPFDLLRLNLGNGMSASGVFVAPKSGKYFFALSGLSDLNVVARLQLQVKTETADWTKIGSAYAHPTYHTFSLHSTLELAKGNQVRVLLLEGILVDNEYHYTHFVGQLVEEDIIQ